jgi:hypothetical protein
MPRRAAPRVARGGGFTSALVGSVVAAAALNYRPPTMPRLRSLAASLAFAARAVPTLLPAQAPGTTPAPVRADTAAIRAAALEYLQGWYTGDAASARVDADTWVDYLQLARVDGRWQIVNVLWALRPRVPASR